MYRVVSGIILGFVYGRVLDDLEQRVVLVTGKSLAGGKLRNQIACFRNVEKIFLYLVRQHKFRPAILRLLYPEKDNVKES